MLNAMITSKDSSGNMIQYPIETFDKPLTWESFRGYPLTFQKLYIEKLKEKYNVSQAKISEMFGIHFSTFSKYCAEHLKIHFDRRRMTDAEKEAFSAFIEKMEKKKIDIAYRGDSAYGEGSMNQIRLVETTSTNGLENESELKLVHEDKDALKMPIVLGENIDSLETSADASKVNKLSKRKTALKDLCLKYDGELDMRDILFTLNSLVENKSTGSMIIKIELE